MIHTGTDVLVEVALPVPVDRTFTYRFTGTIEPGVRVIVPFGTRTMTGVVLGIAESPSGIDPSKIKTVTRVLDAESLFSGDFLEMARWMSQMYLEPLGQCLSAMLPAAKKSRDMVESTGDEPVEHPDYALSDEQEAAIAALTRDAGPNEAGPNEAARRWFYLYGITGSGKTEVFLRAAERVLAAGKSVIYLVPEIALTHQLFAHIQGRFGATAAMLHSGLTASERFSEWRRVLHGDARLIVGARSAIFAPVERLGLIVVDEEHESSYKSGHAPRYHARQVAMWRSTRSGAVCVMGSATPSVESWHLMNEGRLHRLDLTRRLAGGHLPHIEVEDMSGRDSLLSGRLKDAIRLTHREQGQSILFLNRRGFGHVFHCRSCGYQMECPHCSVPLTFHKRNGKMVCHYCGYQTTPVRVCPTCASLDVGYVSFGTERIEEEVRINFPELRVARLDTDSTRKRGETARILEAFASGEVDLLLGTQMVAKGMNFPRVQTVGIVLADTGLSLPDFRAAERTFNLIVQVAGRAGRFQAGGRVIVQTLKPDHPAVALAVRNRIEDFYRQELAVRKQLGFPPFGRLIRLVFRSTSQKSSMAAAVQTAQVLYPLLPEGTELLGPAPCALERVNRNWRHHIILRRNEISALQRVLRENLPEITRRRDVYVEVDVDPVNLL